MGQAIVFVLGLILAKLIVDVVKENISNIGKKTSSTGPVIDLGDAWIDLSQISSQPRGTLLSKEEMQLYQILDGVLKNSNYLTFPKVRLANLLQPNPSIPNRAEYERRLRERVADLLLVEKNSLNPQLLILCPSSQNKKSEPDQLTLRSIETARLPYLIINATDLPSAGGLAQKLQKAGLDI